MREFARQPGFLPFYGTFGADLSFLMAILFTVLFMIGWRMGKKREGDRHHVLVLWAMVSMLAYFTIYYLVQGLGALATEGKEGFGGPPWFYKFVFSPLLTIHILAVSLGLVLAFYMLVLGFRVTVKNAGRRILEAGNLNMSSSAFNKMTLGAFIFFGLLAVIRWGSLGRFMVYLSGFLLVFVVLLAEKGLEKMIPDGARRHRLVGTFTMSLYAIALVTSTATYIMLYVIWPPAAHV